MRRSKALMTQREEALAELDAAAEEWTEARAAGKSTKRAEARVKAATDICNSIDNEIQASGIRRRNRRSSP